jgi:2,4-dienoyl-CoA reductase-like NADH-dependent reductase (Old Yellow Enzyme family)/thioredoxin reductase
MPSLELSHSGMYAGTYMTDKTKQHNMNQWGPSDTVRPDGVEVKALTKDMLQEIAQSYGNVAGLAKRAGFEMLMIHGGHGWLLNQFFSPYFNKRTDEYGGSLENRCRFAIEVLQEVRKAVGPRFPIEFRMSGSELFEGGYDLEEGVRIAQQLEPYIDLLHVSAGTYQRGFGDTHPSMFKEHGCNVYLAAEIKKHVSIPVATIGGLNDPAQLEEIIASGKADIVYMARALLADPFLPRKVTENREGEIVKCLRCFTCMAERAATSTRRCTVNPLIGRELEGDEVPVARVKKKVLVAGAGPGGLYAAYTAARRGHEVILCEKESEVGGILKSEQALPFKHEMYELSGTYKKLAEQAGVEIRLNTEVTPEYVEKENPDALIIAVGSKPLVPPIKGLDGDNVVIVNNYYLEKDKVTDNVVVFGGGLAGCECAIHLGMEGKKVQLVEMRDMLAPDANVRHRPLLLKEIDKYVTVHTGYKGLEVTKEGIICEDKDGNKQLVEGTTVICALGQRSRTDVVDKLRDSAPYVSVIGDAAKVSTITNAVYWGYHSALDI